MSMLSSKRVSVVDIIIYLAVASALALTAFRGDWINFWLVAEGVAAVGILYWCLRAREFKYRRKGEPWQAFLRRMDENIAAHPGRCNQVGCFCDGPPSPGRCPATIHRLYAILECDHHVRLLTRKPLHVGEAVPCPKHHRLGPASPQPIVMLGYGPGLMSSKHLTTTWV